MELPIRYEDRLVATVAADAHGTALRYSDGWIAAPDRFPISLTMPVADTPYATGLVQPWLMNLLPEGEPLRAMTGALGIAAEDFIGLITETGSDLAGALTVAARPRHGEPGYRTIPDEAALERIIADLPARPFLVHDDGVAMSLAGAQDKLPVALLDDKFGVPVNGAPSTHILKPDNPRLIGSVQNEALCMVLAREIGLQVAPVTTGRVGDRSYLLVSRYDRDTTLEPTRRLHQEDMCQALGRHPGAKYEFNRTGARGPSLADMFALVRNHMTARDITRLLDGVILNIAIGNVDSHAKNYSIMLKAAGASLAPLYDLMSGLAWNGITQNHAQAVGGQRRGRHIYKRHWLRMAEAAGLNGPATIRRVQGLTQAVIKALPTATAEVQAMAAGSGAMLDVFADAIAERASLVGAHARQDDGGHDETDTDAGPEISEATAFHG